jgi:Gpi18-like mannosyltransferase
MPTETVKHSETTPDNATVHRGSLTVIGRRLLAEFRRPGIWQQYVILVFAAACAIGMQWELAPYETNDFTNAYRVWFEFLKTNGFSGLANTPSDYNVPYLYLLYVGTLTPLPAAVVVKGIAIFFEFAMAVGFGAITFRLRRNYFVAVAVSVGAFFVPEAVLNVAMWGQSDSIHTALLVWAAYFLMRRRDIPAWVLFALALAFKLQAIFFLPLFLLALIVQRQRWRAPIIGVLTFLVTYVPALIAGRSPSALASIYVTQSREYKSLALGAATFYQWIPNDFFSIWRPAGVFLALGIVALLTLIYLRMWRQVADTRVWLLQAGAAYGVLIPFVLPQMHDRYFFAGDIFVVICTFVSSKYLVPAAILQFTALMSYGWFLFKLPEPMIPFSILAIFQLIAVAWIVRLSLRGISTTSTPYFPLDFAAAPSASRH